MTPVVPALALCGVMASLAVGGGLWFREHDAKVIAEVAAQQAVVAAQAQHDQDQRTIAGLTVAARKAVAVAAATTKLKEAINEAPSTSICATSPAITALVRGLRGSPGGGDAHPAPAIAGNGVAVSSPTVAAGGR